VLGSSFAVALIAALAPSMVLAASAQLPPTQPSAQSRPEPEIPNSLSKGFTFAHIHEGGSVPVSRTPGGRPYKRLRAHTKRGSRRQLPVVTVRGDWLGVSPTMKRNGMKVWMRRNSADVTFVRTMYSVRVDLSQRQLQLRKGTRVVRTASVAIGRPGSSTPTGRFAIASKFSGPAVPSYYGCCALVLNGHQPHLPPGWRGGDRLGLHGTNAPGSIGTAASAGCVRARDNTLRTLIKRLPVGAPVFIQR
jgi:hypothetical protein